MRDLAIQKRHVRLYKSGTQWIVMGITTLTFGVGLMGMTSVVAQAETSAVTTTTTETQTGTSAAVEPVSESTTTAAVSDGDAGDTPVLTNESASSTQATVPDTDSVTAIDETPQTNDAAMDTNSTSTATIDPETATPGTVTTPTQVVKAPNKVTTTSAPTIEPQTHTDVPETNAYEDTVFHQVPIYLNDQLANPVGQDAQVNGKPQGNLMGGISVSDFIAPQHANEIINGAWYDGTNAWMVGFSTDNQTTYVYELDKTGQVVNTVTTPGPDAADFDATWTSQTDAAKLSWEDSLLKISVDSSFMTTPGLMYLADIPVKYVDPAGNELAPEGKVSGYSETYVDAPYPTIAGYRLVSVPYQNDQHQFLINNQPSAEVTADYQAMDLGGGITEYYKILDAQNTQEIYLSVDYIGTITKTEPVIVKADPAAATLFSFLIAMYQVSGTVTVSAPTPVGNPLTFVYEPIQSYQLTVEYVDANTNAPLTTAYQATGIGDYEIESPVIAGYSASMSTVKGNLLADTVVKVLYTAPTSATPGTTGSGIIMVNTPATSDPQTTPVVTPSTSQPEITTATPTVPASARPAVVSDQPEAATGMPAKATKPTVITADASYAKIGHAQRPQLGQLSYRNQAVTVTTRTANQTAPQATTTMALPQTSEGTSTVWAQLGLLALSTLGTFGLGARKKRN